jgi:hypothetical protein
MTQPWGGGMPNDPGQYPGRPANSPEPFHQPNCQGRYGGVCKCFGGDLYFGPGRALSPEESKALNRRNMLGIVNGVLIIPQVLCFFLWIAESGLHHHAVSTLALIAVLLITAVQIRNKVIKGRIKRKYGFR